MKTQVCVGCWGSAVISKEDRTFACLVSHSFLIKVLFWSIYRDRKQKANAHRKRPGKRNLQKSAGVEPVKWKYIYKNWTHIKIKHHKRINNLKKTHLVLFQDVCDELKSKGLRLKTENVFVYIYIQFDTSFCFLLCVSNFLCLHTGLSFSELLRLFAA